MTHPISPVSSAQQAAPAVQPASAVKAAASAIHVAPLDSVKISQAGKAASQSQSSAKPSGDVDHDVNGK